jgi:hypothetical protein
MVTAAERYLKSLTPPIITVAALLALATDEWIQSKNLPPGECMPFDDRLRLCQAAASASDIIVPVPYPAGNAFSELRRTHVALTAASGCSSLLSFTLMGADTVQRLHSLSSVPIIAFVRTDFPFDFDAARRSNPQLHVVELAHHLISLSSTKCRSLMQCGAWNQLVDGGLLPLPVVQMLRSNNWLQHGAASSDTPHSAPSAIAARHRSHPSLLRRNDEDAFFPALPFPDASGLVRHLASLCGAGAAAAVAHDDSAGSDDHDDGQQNSSGAQYSESHSKADARKRPSYVANMWPCSR